MYKTVEKYCLTWCAKNALYISADEAVNQSLLVLQRASATLKRHGTSLGVLDCKVSQSELCRNYATEVLLFR